MLRDKKKVFSKKLENKEELITAKCEICAKISYYYQVKNTINKVIEGQIQSMIVIKEW